MTLEETVDKAIHSGADAIFRWLQSPGGRGSFDQAVAEHLVWFQAARVRGMGWSAIVNVLSHAGVKRDSGLRLSEGHVRGVVSRQQKKVKKMKTIRFNVWSHDTDQGCLPRKIEARVRNLSTRRRKPSHLV